MRSYQQSPAGRIARPWPRITVAALSVGAMVALAACTNEVATASVDPGGEPNGEVSRLGDDATIFAVADHGGMVPVDVAAGEQPRLVITADGTVHRPASTIDVVPGPVISTVESTVLDDEDRTAVFAAIGDHVDELTAAGVDHPGAADAAFTELTLRVGEELVEVTVPAPADGEKTDDLLTEIESIVDGYDEWEVHLPAAVRITSIPYDEEADPEVGPAVEFPLDGAAIAPSEGFGCLDLTGTELDTFVDTIEENEADASTPWMTRGRLFQLLVRPVYTHEAPCGDGVTPTPVEPTPTTVDQSPSTPSTPTTVTPTTKPPTTKPPTTEPPTAAVADGAGCTPGVGALKDGRWYGVVTEVMVDAIDFDLACWFSGDNAVKAAAEDGQESPPPNDYYVRNINPDQRTIKAGDYTSVTWYPSSGDPTSEVTTGYTEWVEADRDGAGVWITIKGGVIVDITEQWTP